MRTTIRVLLGLLGAIESLVGVWALFWPRGFYDAFPLPGHPFVSLLPPFNEHLVGDVGGLSLGLAILLVAGAVRADRWTVRVAGLAGLVVLLPHTIFHAGHLEHFPPVDAVIQTVSTVAQIVALVVVLALSGRLPQLRPATVAA
ncbi:hypothetical protein [Pseudonocardia sp. GCM10023141]|uniref:hypothetical protein n=1 Tax=Pseudonocardia sp. GCM10023141 TaxID=3252653 RepID=UPI003621B655